MKKEVGPFVVRYADFNVTSLIDNNNQYHKSIKMGEAKRIAEEARLDLVCFNKPNGGKLALCKVIDFGKWKYSESKKKKKINSQSKKDTKELRFSPNIDNHDIDHKMKQVNEFLAEGDDVLLTMRLKGRQRAHFKSAEVKMNEIALMCEDAHEVGRRKGSNMIQIRMVKGKKEE